MRPVRLRHGPRGEAIRNPDNVARSAIQSVFRKHSMQMQTAYESWDFTRPVLPPRSRLYSLEPIGIGTPLCESLSGYIARLADAHAVSVGDLVGRGLPRLPRILWYILTAIE